MTYRGHIKNGVVVLDGPVNLPEGSAVEIEPVSAVPPKPKALRALLLSVTGRGVDLPSDGSAQHDHYIYGTPRK